MGLLSRLFGTPNRYEVHAPSDRFAAQAEAITHLLAIHATIPESWITLVGESDAGSELVLQIADESINFLSTEVDLPVFLDSLGLTELAMTAGASTRERVRKQSDPSLWTLDGVTPEELVAVTDALFVQHFGLGPGYRLTGWIEQ